MKAVLFCVWVSIVLGGVHGVVAQIEGPVHEGLLDHAAGNGVAGEPDVLGFGVQGESQGGDQGVQGPVFGGGVDGRSSLRVGLVNALRGGAPVESSPELPPPTGAPEPAVVVGSGEGVLFIESPSTDPVQQTFAPTFPDQSQQVVLPISTETAVQVDGRCEFPECQPGTSASPAVVLPSQEGNERSPTGGQVDTGLFSDIQSLPPAEGHQVSSTTRESTPSSFSPETDGFPLGTAEESSSISEEGSSDRKPSEVGVETPFASGEIMSTGEANSTGPSSVMITGASFTSQENTSNDGVPSTSGKDDSTQPPSEVGSEAPTTSVEDIFASLPSEVRDDAPLESDEGTSNSEAPSTTGEDTSIEPPPEVSSGPPITSEEDTSTGEGPSTTVEITSTDTSSEVSSGVPSTSEEDTFTGEGPSTAVENTSTDTSSEVSSGAPLPSEENTSTDGVHSTPQEDISTSSSSNVTSDVPFESGQNNITASSLGSMSSPPVVEASGSVNNDSPAPSAETMTPAGTLAPSVEETLPPPSSEIPIPTPAAEGSSPSPTPSTETAPPTPSTEETNPVPSTEESQTTPSAESSQSPAGEEQSPAGEVTGPAGEEDDSKSPEEEAEGPEGEEEAREISTAIQDAVQEANTTAVVERLETSDNVEALAEGFTFPTERRVEFLVKTEERVEDGDVVTMKAVAEASLSSKEYNKLAKVFVFSVFPEGNDTLVHEIEDLLRDSELMEKIARADPTRDFLPSTGRRLRRRLTCDGCSPVDSFVCAHCWTSVVCAKFFWCPG